MVIVSKELEEERSRISEFIHQQVESFIYQGLINKIYQKIDPHPSQLNILSINIFLAKALNVKNDKRELVDCIFINNPIQSRDSINIFVLLIFFELLW